MCCGMLSAPATISYLLTYSMVQSPSWEANWFAANQEIPRILWNPQFHYCIHKCPPPVPIPSQLDSLPTKVSVPVRGRSSYFVTRPVCYGEELSALSSTPKLEDHALSAVSDCLFNILAATLHIGGRSSIRNLRTRHTVVTGTHLSRLHQRHTVSKALPEDGADESRNALEC